jgi:hypothetical protein
MPTNATSDLDRALAAMEILRRAAGELEQLLKEARGSKKQFILVGDVFFGFWWGPPRRALAATPPANGNLCSLDSGLLSVAVWLKTAGIADLAQAPRCWRARCSEKIGRRCPAGGGPFVISLN